MRNRIQPSNQRWGFDVADSSVGGVSVLVARGRITSDASARLTQAAVEAIERGERRLIIDLAAVDYVASAGVIALDALSGRMAVAGGALVMCGIDHPAVRRVFELSGLLPHFTIEPSQAAAVARLS